MCPPVVSRGEGDILCPPVVSMGDSNMLCPPVVSRGESYMLCPPVVSMGDSNMLCPPVVSRGERNMLCPPVVSRGEGDMLCPPVVSRAGVILVPTCGVQGEVMGAGRRVDLLRCLQSFLEMILAGAVVELRPRAITEDRKERELGGTRDT